MISSTVSCTCSCENKRDNGPEECQSFLGAKVPFLVSAQSIDFSTVCNMILESLEKNLFFNSVNFYRLLKIFLNFKNFPMFSLPKTSMLLHVLLK